MLFLIKKKSTSMDNACAMYGVNFREYSFPVNCHAIILGPKRTITEICDMLNLDSM
jgi:hypothetical protein